MWKFLMAAFLFVSAPAMAQDEFTFESTSSANPHLWLNMSTLGTDATQYVVADSTPEADGEWMSVNQFCSLLSIYWLDHPSSSLKFGSLSGSVKLAMAKQLVKYDSMASQENFATSKMSSAKKLSKSQFKDIIDDEPETLDGKQLWFGNDAHVRAATFSEKSDEIIVKVYDSNYGSTKTMKLADFQKKLSSWGIDSFVLGS